MPIRVVFYRFFLVFFAIFFGIPTKCKIGVLLYMENALLSCLSPPWQLRSAVGTEGNSTEPTLTN